MCTVRLLCEELGKTPFRRHRKLDVRKCREGNCSHKGLPAEFPKFRPVPAQSLYAAKRGPPDENCQLDPRVDQYDAIDPPAPED